MYRKVHHEKIKEECVDIVRESGERVQVGNHVKKFVKRMGKE